MAKIFKKLNVSDTVATSGTRFFKKLSTFVINGTYLLNDTITELPIVYEDGEDIGKQTAVRIGFCEGRGAYRYGFATVLDNEEKKLQYGAIIPLNEYSFETNSWRNDRNRYVTFNNQTAENIANEDITQIFYEWLTANATKQGQITFTIDGITYTADEGMCWGQWINSTYNTAGYINVVTINDFISKGDNYIATAVSDGTTDYRVKKSDVIIAGYNYALYNPDVPTPGLYDSNGDLLADWDTLVNTYGMIDGGDYDDVDSYANSPAEVFSNNEELASGTKLIISKDMLNSANSAFVSNHSGAYSDCINLESVVLSEGTRFICVKMFYGCTSLKSITIPSSVYDIGGSAFGLCSALSHINIPADVEYLGVSAFLNCTSLKNITIPDKLTDIRLRTFDGCTSLESIIIPDKITRIWGKAFLNCNALKDVYYQGTEEQWAAITIDEGNEPLLNATIHYNYTG